MTDYYNWMVSGWGEGLFCSAANGRQVDLVVIGTERHGPQRFTIYSPRPWSPAGLQVS